VSCPEVKKEAYSISLLEIILLRGKGHTKALGQISGERKCSAMGEGGEGKEKGFSKGAIKNSSAGQRKFFTLSVKNSESGEVTKGGEGEKVVPHYSFV